MSNLIGNRLRLMIYGQSHAPSIGAVIEGLPSGFVPDWEKVSAFMARRAPGSSSLSTARKEADLPEILSGLNERGETCGAPLAMRIQNGDTRSKDYARLRDVPRPGHADYSAYVRFGGCNDIRGGGQFSGRLTAPLCFAGALAMQLLEKEGVQVGAHIASIEGVEDTPFDPLQPDFAAVSGGDLAVLNEGAGEQMREAIHRAKTQGDSVGGVIECAATGLPAGLGDPMFDGVENQLARAFFGIPAVRGVEFGFGFSASRMRGSEHNDAFETDGVSVFTATNRHGGILGGITTGMPVIARIAIKPTPSIACQQRSVSLSSLQTEDLVVSGRHDPCIVPRAVPCAEAAMAFVLYDLLAERSR